MTIGGGSFFSVVILAVAVVAVEEEEESDWWLAAKDLDQEECGWVASSVSVEGGCEGFFDVSIIGDITGFCDSVVADSPLLGESSLSSSSMSACDTPLERRNVTFFSRGASRTAGSWRKRAAWSSMDSDCVSEVLSVEEEGVDESEGCES